MLKEKSKKDIKNMQMYVFYTKLMPENVCLCVDIEI